MLYFTFVVQNIAPLLALRVVDVVALPPCLVDTSSTLPRALKLGSRGATIVALTFARCLSSSVKSYDWPHFLQHNGGKSTFGKKGWSPRCLGKLKLQKTRELFKHRWPISYTEMADAVRSDSKTGQQLL